MNGLAYEHGPWMRGVHIPFPCFRLSFGVFTECFLLVIITPADSSLNPRAVHSPRANDK